GEATQLRAHRCCSPCSGLPNSFSGNRLRRLCLDALRRCLANIPGGQANTQPEEAPGASAQHPNAHAFDSRPAYRALKEDLSALYSLLSLVPPFGAILVAWILRDQSIHISLDLRCIDHWRTVFGSYSRINR